MEAERAMLKLLRGLDKHLQHVQQTAAAGASQPADAEPSATEAAQSEPPDELSSQSNTMHGLQTAQPEQQDVSRSNSAMPEMWENPLAVMDNTVHSRQPQVRQGSQHGLTDSAPHQPLQGAKASSPSSQAGSGWAGHQEPDQAIVARSPRPTSDQQTGRSTGDARRSTGDARCIIGDPRRITGDPRRLTEDARRITGGTETQRVTRDIQLPMEGGTLLPADRAVTLKWSESGRKEKLEYRLSRDDVYSPSSEEVQALLQQGLTNTQQQQPQQQQQQPSYAVAAASDVASNMQSSLHGVSEGGRSSAASIVADASVMSGLSGSQAAACLQQEEPSMLSLICRVKEVQVGLELMAWPAVGGNAVCLQRFSASTSCHTCHIFPIVCAAYRCMLASVGGDCTTSFNHTGCHMSSNDIMCMVFIGIMVCLMLTGAMYALLLKK